jgi:HEAT repeat protein
MPTQDYQQFYDSCFGNTFGALHDGVDEQAILNLKGEERKEAERLLLEALGTNRDTHSRAVIGLGLLGSQAAIEPLKIRLDQATEVDRMYIARALYQIEKFPGAEQIMIESLNTMNNDENTRWLAVSLLPGFGRTDWVVKALLEAMKNEGAIGYSAAAFLRAQFIDDVEVRDLLGQILLNGSDACKPYFVPRNELVQQATDLINSRLS